MIRCTWFSCINASTGYHAVHMCLSHSRFTIRFLHSQLRTMSSDRVKQERFATLAQNSISANILCVYKFTDAFHPLYCTFYWMLFIAKITFDIEICILLFSIDDMRVSEFLSFPRTWILSEQRIQANSLSFVSFKTIWIRIKTYIPTALCIFECIFPTSITTFDSLHLLMLLLLLLLLGEVWK